MSNSRTSLRKIEIAAGLNRRRFIYLSTFAAAAAFTPQTFAKKPKFNSPGQKLRVAIIGSGGRGGANLGEISKTEEIVALCDVNEDNLNSAGAKFPKAKKFIDFRELFDKAANDFDAVAVSSTEHTHAFAVMPALKLGKHVYCEKPLTHSVWEARQITEAAKKAGVVTQMGIQIHAGNNYRRVVELVQSGAIGKISEAHVWVQRAWGLQSAEKAIANEDRISTQERPKDAMPVPPGLNWDLWLGPAPERPFHEVYFPGPRWYRWWDFGGGTMSDLGSHWNDLAFWALKLDHPRTIEAHGPAPHPEIAPATMSVTYEYGARGDLPPVKVHWHQGEVKPKIWEEKKIPQWPSGALFIGDKGMILSDYGKHVLLPEENFKDFKQPDHIFPDSPGHHQEWIAACKGQGKCLAPFDYSGPLTEANHLGNVAHRAGKKIEWDWKKMKITNAPEANKFIHREYRKGWSLV